MGPMTAPVSLVLLRGLLPDVPLKPGTIVNGRVLNARTVVLEGVRLQTTLPEGVEPGMRLRFQVKEATTERIHLQVVGPPEGREAQQAQQTQTAAQAQEVPPAAYALALPGGVTARIHVTEQDEEEERRGAGRQVRAVVVRYDSPTLGRMDVRLDGLAAAVHVSAGEPADRVREAADVLREALARAAGGPVQVTVHPRAETVNVRA
jgi:hypothetical protein